MANKHNVYRHKKTKRAKATRRAVQKRYAQKATDSISTVENINLTQQDVISTDQPIDNAIATTSKSSVDFQFINDEELDNIQNHKLIIETSDKLFDNRTIIEGNRVVELGYVLNWALSLQDFHRRECLLGNLTLFNEVRKGLICTLYFKCAMCNKIISKCTEDPNKLKSPTNIGVVWGTDTSGSTYTHTKHLLNVMNVPMMSHSTFVRQERILGDVWEKQRIESIILAGKREFEIAESKNLIENGVGKICVLVDGGWSKRSYGHNYNASSGVACIIGKETKELLFIGVRNKYCSICQVAKYKGVTPKEHVCYKNWSGSSSSMEADIIVEGFNNSEEMHNLQYTTFIGDGDSSVFARIREKVTYGKSVTKIECLNHLIKNYSSALYKIISNTKLPIKCRSELKANMPRLTMAVRAAVRYNKGKPVSDLRQDLKNGPSHVFGFHENCREYFCKHEKKYTASDSAIVESGVLDLILAALQNIIRKSDRLNDGEETSNLAELFMSFVAKYNAGKRLNLTQRDNFNRRCNIAALNFNKGRRWHYSSWKSHLKYSPGKYFKKNIEMKTKVYIAEKKSKRQLFPPRTAMDKPVMDSDYGPFAEDVISNEELEKLSNEKLLIYQVTLDEIEDIQEKSIGQHGNTIYDANRADRLTASMFGKVCKRLAHTSCHNLVKECLYGTSFYNTSTKYGVDHESVAIQRFERENNLTVRPCGIFIDAVHGFLAASPDGIVKDGRLIEVKCVPSLLKKNISIEEAAATVKTFCLEKIGDKTQLKRNHNYYYQVQGQLHIANKSHCYFVVFLDSSCPIFTEIIEKDDNFWSTKMEPKLIKFFKTCMLPEIILRRIPKGQKCKESAEILAAQLERTKTKK